MRSIYVLAGLSLAVLTTAGCGTRRFTDTPRTASEQLLIAAAVDQAIQQLEFSPIADRKVYLDDQFIDRVDESFVVATVRARAMTEGVLLVDKLEEASYVMELRSGAVGVDRNDFVLGIPESALPTPGGSVSLPEAAAYKSVRQSGATRVSFVVYRRDDRRLLYASGPAYGFSRQNSQWFFGAGPVINDNVAPDQTQENTAQVKQVSEPPLTAPDSDQAQGEQED